MVRSAAPSEAVHFRACPYGKRGIREFLIDVLALANVNTEGPRYILIGADVDETGRKTIRAVDDRDFSGDPDYQALVADYIEPCLRLRYHRLTVGETQLGVYEIGDTPERPYMMRMDYCETLRRGDAYMRINLDAVKVGRRLLQAMFEEHFRDSISPAQIEIGFPGDIIFKECRVPTCDFALLPSALAASRLREMMEVKKAGEIAGPNTAVERLSYARLFGPDAPYENHGVDSIRGRIEKVDVDYAREDERFLFEDHSCELQLIAYNQGEATLRNAGFSVALPRHPDIRVAESLNGQPIGDASSKPSPALQSGYPQVRQDDKCIKISARIGDIGPGEVREVFAVPPRLCFGTELSGRKIGINFTLTASNLRQPANGRLNLRPEGSRCPSPAVPTQVTLPG